MWFMFISLSHVYVIEGGGETTAVSPPLCGKPCMLGGAAGGEPHMYMYVSVLRNWKKRVICWASPPYPPPPHPPI